MTISWVAEENPNITAATAMRTSGWEPDPGSIHAIHKMARMIPVWETSIHDLLRPKDRVRKGMGIWSTRGAQMNLNEYPRAAQLKKVTEALSTPASLSHRERDEKIRRRGRPAENPNASMVNTLG